VHVIGPVRELDELAAFTYRLALVERVDDIGDESHSGIQLRSAFGVGHGVILETFMMTCNGRSSARRAALPLGQMQNAMPPHSTPAYVKTLPRVSTRPELPQRMQWPV
jgi:hypothetical protein